MAYRIYLTVKHFHADPFKVWHSLDDAVRPLRPSRVLSFYLACGLVANEEQVESLKAHLQAAGAKLQ